MRYRGADDSQQWHSLAQVTRRASVQVDGPDDPRWTAALEALRSGHLIQIGSLVLGLDRDGPQRPGAHSPLTAEIIAPSWWHRDMNDAAREQCREAIRSARETVAGLSAEDSAFKSLMQGRSFAVVLVTDWDTGAVLKARVNHAGDPEWR